MSETKVVTGLVRFSYVNVFTPREGMNGGDPKYSMAILIPKSDKEMVQKIKNAIEAAKENGKKTWGGKVPPALKTPLRDGDSEKDTEEYPEYKGMYWINCTSKTKPGIIDVAKKQITDPEEVYSGCYGKVSINFYPFDSGKKGIAAGLCNILKVKDGERLAGKSSAESDFSEDLSGELDDVLGLLD